MVSSAVLERIIIQSLQLGHNAGLCAVWISEVGQPLINHSLKKTDLFQVCYAAFSFSVLPPDGDVPLERFHRILNETAHRLSMLRGSVESPTLGSKIQKLQSAAKEQQSRLSLIEQDIQEITEERDSLRDIALNLPQSCPEATGAGKG